MAKPAFPKTNMEKAKLYLHAMVEVKERLHVTVSLLDLPIAPLFKSELCYLQLRYVCELVAIARLAAQGDYKTQRAFAESYKPPEIFKALRKVYPDFFPLPAERTVSLKGDTKHHHVNHSHKDDAYDEAAISSLWNFVGNLLHRTSVTKYLQTTFVNKPPELAQITDHIKGLVTLLDSHLIPIQRDGHKQVMLLIEMGQRHEAVRLMFLNLDRSNGSVQIEEYSAALRTTSQPQFRSNSILPE